MIVIKIFNVFVIHTFFFNLDSLSNQAFRPHTELDVHANFAKSILCNLL